MGNIEACMNPEPSGNYKAPVEFPDHIIQLSGEQSVLGRSVVVSVPTSFHVCDAFTVGPIQTSITGLDRQSKSKVVP